MPTHYFISISGLYNHPTHIQKLTLPFLLSHENSKLQPNCPHSQRMLTKLLALLLLEKKILLEEDILTRISTHELPK